MPLAAATALVGRPLAAAMPDSVSPGWTVCGVDALAGVLAVAASAAPSAAIRAAFTDCLQESCTSVRGAVFARGPPRPSRRRGVMGPRKARCGGRASRIGSPGGDSDDGGGMTTGATGRRPLLTAAITGLGLGGGAGSAQAASKLVFADFDSAVNEQLFTVRSDASHLHQVTPGHAFKSSPSWSPDQRRIVYSRVKDAPARLVIVRPNGTHAHVIPHTKYATDPSWSPSGKRIAYDVGNGHNGIAIFTIRPDGRHRRRLPAFWQNTDPDWSPNGSSIVSASTQGIRRMRSNGRHKQLVSSTGF